MFDTGGLASSHRDAGVSPAMRDITQSDCRQSDAFRNDTSSTAQAENLPFAEKTSEWNPKSLHSVTSRRAL